MRNQWPHMNNLDNQPLPPSAHWLVGRRAHRVSGAASEMAFSAQWIIGRVQTSAVYKNISYGPKKEPAAQQRPRCQPKRIYVDRIETIIGWQTPWGRLDFFAPLFGAIACPAEGGAKKWKQSLLCNNCFITSCRFSSWKKPCHPFGVVYKFIFN